jgi:hypothetical protein
MKLQAKTRLLSYKVKPVKDHYLSDMMEIGSILIEDGVLKPWKQVQGYSFFLGPLPATRHYAKGTVMIAVQREGRVVVSAMFEPLQGKFEPVKNLLLKRFGTVYTPHIAMAPETRGKGLALLIYTAMITGGSCFWTRKHTQDAAALWKRVARQPGVSMVAVNPLGQTKYPEYAGIADGMLLCPTSMLEKQ